MRNSVLSAALITAALASASHADILKYWAFLDGPSEFPPIPSNGIGYTRVTIDTTAGTYTINSQWTGLTGNTSNSHIHAATVTAFTGLASVASQSPTFPGFPSGVTAGTFNATYDLNLASSYNASFVTANGGTAASAKAAYLAAIAAGKAYHNVHSSFAGGGEIRGFLRPQCPADLTTGALPGAIGYGFANGTLNNDDFFYYLSQFSANNLAVADLTTGAVPGTPGYGVPNGIINNDDFFYYLSIFSAGC